MLAHAQSVTLIYDDNSNYQAHFVSDISDKLSTVDGVTLSTISSLDLPIESLKNNLPDIVISLNDTTSEMITGAQLQTSVFHVLTTIASSRRYAPCLPDCSEQLPNHHFFVLDPLPARQAQLIKLIKPSIKNVAVIVTNFSKPQLKYLKPSIKNQGLNLQEYLTDAESVRYLIDDVSKTSDVILAVADTNIYNAASLSQILLTSYRYRTPVIGFSKGFIKAGALSGTVSTIEQITQHVQEIISSTQGLNPKLGSLIFPKYFDVLSNRNVARSLNLHFPSDEELKAIIQSDEVSQ